MFVAERIFLIANTERAKKWQVTHPQPQVGERGVWTLAGPEGIDLVFGVDLVGEVVFGGPIELIPPPPIDAEAGAAEVHRVGERWGEPGPIDRLHGPRARRIDGVIELDEAADADGGRRRLVPAERVVPESHRYALVPTPLPNRRRRDRRAFFAGRW